MFEIEPNTVYTKTTLSKDAGLSYNTVSSWFKSGLKHKGRYTTGRAVLEFFESESEVEIKPINHKLETKLSKAYGRRNG